MFDSRIVWYNLPVNFPLHWNNFISIQFLKDCFQTQSRVQIFVLGGLMENLGARYIAMEGAASSREIIEKSTQHNGWMIRHDWKWWSSIRLNNKFSTKNCYSKMKNKISATNFSLLPGNTLDSENFLIIFFLLKYIALFSRSTGE